MDWVRAAVNPLGCRTSFSYNAAGQPVAVIDANSTRATTVFDATGRAVATVNALGYRVSQVFDSAGRRTALVDARANRYTFVWDYASRQIRQVDPLSRAVTLAYNAASEETLRIDARGFRTTYVHDNLSRLTGRQYPDGSRVTMAYDAVSNRTLLADSTGRYTTLIDSLNRARAVTNPAQLTISYGFDAAGRRSWMIEPSGGRFTYGYSPTDLNTLVVNPQGERTTWQFDAASRVIVQRLANLIRVSYAYDDADRLVRLANLTSTGTTITSYRDTWDPANNRLARVEQDGTRVTWSYDPTYQLTRERRNGANSYDTTYAYDPAGNRRLKLDNSIRTTYSYDPANQLQKYVDNTGTTTFGFDASGNQRFQQTPSSGTTTNTWDYESRLTTVALPSGILNTFAYSGDGQRVERLDSSGTSKLIWDDQKIVEETDQNNVAEAIYTCATGGFGGVVSQRRSGVTNYYLFDPLGSTVRLTGGNESVISQYAYKAFGDLLVNSAVRNPFRYQGTHGYYYQPDLGLFSPWMRDLAPRLGIFLSTDPIFSISETGLYVYARNRPTVMVDPTGLLASNCSCKVAASSFPHGKLDCAYGDIPRVQASDFFGAAFDVVAQFAPPSCFCCEYRQYVRGKICTMVVPFEAVPQVPLKCEGLKDGIQFDDGTYYEDGTCSGQSGVARPGHRGSGGANEVYFMGGLFPYPFCGFGNILGCVYAMADAPGVEQVSVFAKKSVPFFKITIDLHFIGQIIDTCNDDKVIATAKWDVQCNVNCKVVNGNVKCEKSDRPLEC